LGGTSPAAFSGSRRPSGCRGPLRRLANPPNPPGPCARRPRGYALPPACARPALGGRVGRSPARSSHGLRPSWCSRCSPMSAPLRLRPPRMGGGRVGMAAARRRGAREGLPCCGRGSAPDPVTFARACRLRRPVPPHRCACASMSVAPDAGSALRTCHMRARLRRFLLRPFRHTGNDEARRLRRHVSRDVCGARLRAPDHHWRRDLPHGLCRPCRGCWRIRSAPSRARGRAASRPSQTERHAPPNSRAANGCRRGIPRRQPFAATTAKATTTRTCHIQP